MTRVPVEMMRKAVDRIQRIETPTMQSQPFPDASHSVLGRRDRSFHFLLFIIPCFFLTGCASPQDISVLDGRLAQIERQTEKSAQRGLLLEKELSRIDSQIETDGKELAESIQQIRDRTAGLYASLEALNDSVQLLYGKAEEIDHTIREQSGELANQDQNSIENLHRVEATANTNNDRIARLEHYLGFEPSEVSDFPLESGDLDKKNLTDAEIYALAKRSFDQADYEVARRTFQRILTGFPRSENADNAQFWIGETYYREKWYQKAIEGYPRGNKVPAALLKQGLAFSNIRDQGNARLIFKELTKKFPKSTEASIAKKKLQELGK